MTLLDPATMPAYEASDPDPTGAATSSDLAALDLEHGLGTTFLLGTALVAAWVASIAAALSLETGHALHMSALFLHLACLIAGFGAVLTLDWLGLLWLSGRRALGDVLDVAEAAHPLIWLGLLGLTATGMLLEPSLTPLTCVKLTAVLLVGINGLNAMRLNQVMARVTGSPSRRVMAWSAVTVSISQLGWWTACLIGFLNAH
jgi:hypothetical protein